MGIETIKEAKEYLRKNFNEGVNCPCCNQFVKLYKRKLGSMQSQGLIILYDLNKQNEWVHVREITKNINLTGDFAKMSYWKLIQEKPNVGEFTKNSGYWKITQRGKDFVDNKIQIPSHALVYNSKCFGFSEEKTNIVKSLGKKFNYNNLMNNK